ncbi:uncharacterized protein LOC135834000 [Planococcus citri]|uniref:uncharacterized protein LOC135834000 n=1 Tax=Planococcus citri TaxID=170843 RepID=UPI0031F95287
MSHSLSGWDIYPNSSNNLINDQGYFTIIKPLSEVMGFFEDFRQCMVCVPQSLIFHNTTASDNIMMYSDNTGYNVTVIFKEIIWRMRHVKLRIDKEIKLRKEVLGNTNFTMFYRHWLYQCTAIPAQSTEYTWEIPVAYSRVKWVIVAFQKDSSYSINKRMSQFELFNVENVQLSINNYWLYPKDRLNVKVGERKAGNLYDMFLSFPKSYYNRQECDPICDYGTFLSKYPMIAIDCSHQPETVKDSLINAKLLINLREGFPINAKLHLVMIMDRKVIYNPLTNQVIT